MTGYYPEVLRLLSEIDVNVSGGTGTSGATKANQSLILDDGDATIANQSVIIANQSTILDTVGNDATLANQTSILTDGENLIANTTTIYKYIIGTQIYDDFNNNSKNLNIWGTDSITAQTAINNSDMVTRISNPGTGVNGYSYRPTLGVFGKSVEVVCNIYNVTSSGGRAEAYIELYKNATNYFQFGMYRDTSDVKDVRGAVHHKISTVANESIDWVDNTSTDHVDREYRIIVDEHNVQVKLDRQLLGTYQFEELDDYYVRVVAGTDTNTDIIKFDFNNFEIIPYVERQEEIYDRLESIQGGSNSIQTIQTAMDTVLDLARAGDSGNASIGSNWSSIYENVSTDRPMLYERGYLDLNNMNVSDTYQVRVRMNLYSGASYSLLETQNFSFVQTNPIKELGPYYNQYGMTIDMRRTNGSDRLIYYEHFDSKA